MKKLFQFVVILIIASACTSKTKVSNSEVLAKVSTEELKKHVFELADDKYEGRAAGYKGEKEASIYIAEQFKNAGLTGISGKSSKPEDYFQSFEFEVLDSNIPWEKLTTQNVLGVLKGSEKPDEYIIIGGHHDGQGMIGQADAGRGIPEDLDIDSTRAANDNIWNSAVDNAVSISAIIEIARVLKKHNIKLKRSVIFTGFSAEENGLDGSIHFANNPPVPIENIKGMINLEKIIGDPDAEFLYVSYGTNPIFEDIRQETDSIVGLNMKPFYPGMIANSDHYAFGQRKKPTVTIGTGSRINVHTALDHADGLDYKLLNKRTQYILFYLLKFANADSDFEFTGSLDGLLGVAGGLASEQEKEQKNFKGQVAFKITSVVKDSQGFEAGLKSGDLIIAIDNKPPKRKAYYSGLEDLIGDVREDAIGEVAQEKATLKLIRGNETIERTIFLK